MRDIIDLITYWAGIVVGMIGAAPVVFGQPRTLDSVALMASGAFVVAVSAYLKASR